AGRRQGLGGTPNRLPQRAIGLVDLDHLLQGRSPIGGAPAGMAIRMEEARKLAIARLERALVYTKSARDAEDFEVIRHRVSRFEPAIRRRTTRRSRRT